MRNLNWIIVWIIAIFLIAPLARSTHAQSSERCFRETGFCISGRIRAYWEKHGGLEIFGYPITAVRKQTNKDAWTCLLYTSSRLLPLSTCVGRAVCAGGRSARVVGRGTFKRLLLPGYHLTMDI